jgi:uncharacterized 2Fe-2S/4Fe-4S cluster protein (DUF4445 family)
VSHRVSFTPSGRSALVDEGTTIADAAARASEPLRAECGGRGACGRCLVRIVEGAVPEYRVLRRHDGHAEVHACLTPVHGPLTVLPLVDAELPKLIARDRNAGVAPIAEWAPWLLALDPLVTASSPASLGVAIDIGTTTLRLVVVRLADGVIVGEASSYNPQIARGADVISRIIAAEKGFLGELSASIRSAVRTLIAQALSDGTHASSSIRAYVVAGNLTMIHLLLGVDPSGIRRVPSEPHALRFAAVDAASLQWPGEGAPVHTLPAAGGWVGGDIVAGIVRSGFSRASDGLTLYVDLGTNGEIALGGADFVLACACSAGPAFEGGGIRCGMRADRGAIDGARVDKDAGTLDLSVIGGGRARGVCGSGLIALAHALFQAGWIDRSARVSDLLPPGLRASGEWGAAVALTGTGKVALWERDLTSLLRAKAAIFAGIRSLVASLGEGVRVDRAIVSGNFGRYLNLPAAVGIGLLPDLPLGRYSYVDNGALEGAALALLSRAFMAEVDGYLSKITYINLSDLPHYMDELVGACFFPHTDPQALCL